MDLTVKSGAKVVINTAPFEDALALNNAIGQLLPSIDIKMDAELNIDVASMAKVMVVVGTQAPVQTLVMKCLARCTYNGQAITPSTFEPVTAREDYYECAIACVKENIGPFVNSLFSQFSGLLEAMPKNPAATQK